MKADEAHKYGMVDEVLNKWYEWGRNFMFLLR
jgi:ATP-dependent protease ClpP protease subunit